MVYTSLRFALTNSYRTQLPPSTILPTPVLCVVQVASDFQAPEMALDTARHRLGQGLVAAASFKVNDAACGVDSPVHDAYHFHFENCKLALKELSK